MAKLLNVFARRRRRLEQELERELRYHLDRRVEELKKDGLGEDEAARRAGLELGGVFQVQEDVRDTWTFRWLDDLVRDTRYALRSLARSWGFALGAGGVLALGTGATIAVFSVVHTVLLRPLPYADAERILAVETLWTNTGQPSPGVSAPGLPRLAGPERRLRADGVLRRRDRRGHRRRRERRVRERHVRVARLLHALRPGTGGRAPADGAGPAAGRRRGRDRRGRAVPLGRLALRHRRRPRSAGPSRCTARPRRSWVSRRPGSAIRARPISGRRGMRTGTNRAASSFQVVGEAPARRGRRAGRCPDAGHRRRTRPTAPGEPAQDRGRWLRCTSG